MFPFRLYKHWCLICFFLQARKHFCKSFIINFQLCNFFDYFHNMFLPFKITHFNIYLFYLFMCYPLLLFFILSFWGVRKNIYLIFIATDSRRDAWKVARICCDLEIVHSIYIIVLLNCELSFIFKYLISCMPTDFTFN